MIRRSAFAAIGAGLLASSAIAQAPAAATYDLLIDNGTIYDGLGEENGSKSVNGDHS